MKTKLFSPNQPVLKFAVPHEDTIIKHREEKVQAKQQTLRAVGLT